jgi:hypothetical protein
MKLHLNSPIYLHDIVFNYLILRALPLTCLKPLHTEINICFYAFIKHKQINTYRDEILLEEI